jgi:hypothetical protein
MTKLPQHPHIEYLRKQAKQRFALMKQRASGARLADAQYWLAREYGFSNWRALKEEVSRRMGVVRMAPLPNPDRRFRALAPSADEELEADGFFQRGAATMSIGLIAALLIAAMALLSAGRAFGQTSQGSIAMSPRPKTIFSVTRDGGGHHLVLTYGAGKISGVAILDWP